MKAQEQLKILIIEEMPNVAKLLADKLIAGGTKPNEIAISSSRASALKRFKNGFLVVFADERQCNKMTGCFYPVGQRRSSAKAVALWPINISTEESLPNWLHCLEGVKPPVETIVWIHPQFAQFP